MEHRLKKCNPAISAKMGVLRHEIEAEFGISTRLLRMLVGPLLLATSSHEDRRLANGVTYEPQTFIERKNWVDEAKTDKNPEVAVMPKRGFAPAMQDIAARVGLEEEPALTVIGD
jgi:hypothetical protein